MNYMQRINKVTDYIGKHLDEQLTLEQLSKVACFSKYHFHRLFSAHTGLSLQQYIRWMRLNRAAHQLVVLKDKSILDIALDAGFETHESFTRAFKQACGLSPSEFKRELNWQAWEEPPYIIPKIRGDNMNVTIKNKSAKRLAAVEHHGDPNDLIKSVNKLIEWANKPSVDLKLKDNEIFGFTYNDPKLVPKEEFRFDFAMTIPEELKLQGEIVERRIPAGRYAVTVHKGSRDNIGDTIYALYRDWLPQSNEKLGDLPCVFCYKNFDHNVAETELLTECWLLLE